MTRAALVLAEEGLPVPGQAVLDAAVLTWTEMTCELRQRLQIVTSMGDGNDVDRVVRQIQSNEPGSSPLAWCVTTTA